MGVLSEQSVEFLERCRRSRRLVLIIVAIALLLDNMLLTTVGKYCIGYEPICKLKLHKRQGFIGARTFNKYSIVDRFPLGQELSGPPPYILYGRVDDGNEEKQKDR